MADFIHRSKEIDRHLNRLPHWQQKDAMQFVTFRLADAMPAKKLVFWKQERNEWMKWNPKPWNEKQKAEFEKLFHEKLEEWLDEGAGSCLFRERGNRVILEEVLMRAQGKWAEHEAWVNMPNHAHVLFRPLMPLQDLVKVWKGVSARRMKEGSIWQKDYRDRLIRDQEHFQNVVRYIRKNPAKLKEDEFTLWESERAKEIT